MTVGYSYFTAEPLGAHIPFFLQCRHALVGIL